MLKKLWPPLQDLLTFTLLLSTATFAPLSLAQTTHPNTNQGYPTCMTASCVQRYTKPVSISLLSGERVQDYEVSDKFDMCTQMCLDHPMYKNMNATGDGHLNSNYERLEAVCIERLSGDWPLRIKIQLHIEYKEPKAATIQRTQRLLHVIEVWRSIATTGNMIEKQLASRHYTVSNYFVVPYDFVEPPTRERFFIRIFSHSENGVVGRPLKTESLGADSVTPLTTSSSRKPLMLSARDARALPSGRVHLIWTNVDDYSVPACTQELVWSSNRGDSRRLWISLDSSHVVPLSDINSNLTYKVRLTSRYDEEAKLGDTAAATFELMSLTANGHQETGWSEYLDGYRGLVICTTAVVLLLAFVCLIIFFCHQCRQRRPNALSNLKSVPPQDPIRTTSSKQSSTSTVATEVVDQRSTPDSHVDELDGGVINTASSDSGLYRPYVVGPAPIASTPISRHQSQPYHVGPPKGVYLGPTEALV